MLDTWHSAHLATRMLFFFFLNRYVVGLFVFVCFLTAETLI